MKSKLFLLLGLSIFTLSCSSDDSSGDDNGEPATSLPIVSGNYWTYDVFNHETVNTPESFARDSVYVGNDTLINTVTFKKIKTLTIANGFYSGTLKDNGLRIDGNKMRISGSLNFAAGLPTTLAFSVSDFIVLKENASAGEELSTTNGSFTQDFNGYPLTFNYTLRSVSDGTQNSFSSNGNTYSNITKTKVILNLKVTTLQTIPGFPNPIEIPVMPAQDVLVSNQYYSKNIGMVYNLTNINYTLSTLPAGYQLPIPQTGSQTQEEFLDVYQVN
ncbi:hypothetical protein FLGE108171_01970 [Flavobacterium gelidilacus]|jgi:hypothetical protein|uniref:hypothetical protein n=1 Tax=Flavobacterium gelidilacus TaxID=206041 RepID=UPI00041D55A2|nr:hypothetical protein [Flavobacterium gelidilacus]